MRRRYVLKDGDLVDVTDAPQEELHVDAGALWTDKGYAGLTAPDGTPIDTRSKHRQYMRDKGLTTVDDYTQQWSRAAKDRADFYQKAPDPQRAWDLARALEKHRG